MAIRLGCVADDMTGACDLALMLANAGMQTTLCLGIPSDIVDSDALVVALKTRTIQTQEACTQVLETTEKLLEGGAEQIYFKYCSTFDSTPTGNIGPVTLQLMKALDSDFTVVCPAFPANGRTVRRGNLYVYGVPLAESPMRSHPLTPMTRSDLTILMDEQTETGASGSVVLDTVRDGPTAISEAFRGLRNQGHRFAVTDAETDSDLMAIAHACDQMPLVTGASGLAAGIADNFQRRGALKAIGGLRPLPEIPGNALILAGSCSAATRTQVENVRQQVPTMKLDALALAEDQDALPHLIDAARKHLRQSDLLVYSTTDPEHVGRIQERLGVTASAEIIESAFSILARAMVDEGTAKLVVAGGETSGAVAGALGLKFMDTGPEIEPGVPWMIAHREEPLVIAFKSGNFGSRDFFTRALEMVV